MLFEGLHCNQIAGNDPYIATHSPVTLLTAWVPHSNGCSASKVAELKQKEHKAGKQ